MPLRHGWPALAALALAACGSQGPVPATADNVADAETADRNAADAQQVNRMVADTRLETLESRVATLENQVDALRAQSATRADIGAALATAPPPPAAAVLPPPAPTRPPPRLPYVAPLGHE